MVEKRPFKKNEDPFLNFWGLQVVNFTKKPKCQKKHVFKTFCHKSACMFNKMLVDIFISPFFTASLPFFSNYLWKLDLLCLMRTKWGPSPQLRTFMQTLIITQQSHISQVRERSVTDSLTDCDWLSSFLERLVLLKMEGNPPHKVQERLWEFGQDKCKWGTCWWAWWCKWCRQCHCCRYPEYWQPLI